MAWGPANFGGRKPVVSAARSDLLSPTGSPAIRAALQRRALRTSRNQRRRGEVLSRLAGLDPMQQRQAMVDTERDASGTLSDFLNSADENQLLGQQDFLRGNYRQERGFSHDRAMAELMQRFQRENSGGIGSFLGDLLGSVGGAYLGGPASPFLPRRKP